MAELNFEYAEVAEMFRRLQALEAGSVGYRRQREVIIQRCLPLARHIARRYGGRGEPHDDLVQAACVGLVNAVNRFNLENGADFVSFAIPTMMGEVRKHFRDYADAGLARRVGDALGGRQIQRHRLLDKQRGACTEYLFLDGAMGMRRNTDIHRIRRCV